MSNQEILEKAIQKAIDGGWKREYKVRYTISTGNTSVDDWETYAPIIFQADFAKALWSSGEYSGISLSYAKEGWQYHLQQMVIAEDPIKYLGENL